MKYQKNLVDDYFDIKEKQNEEDKIILERFLEQYNKMYAEYREFQKEKEKILKYWSKEMKKSDKGKRKKKKKGIKTEAIFFGGAND